MGVAVGSPQQPTVQRGSRRLSASPARSAGADRTAADAPAATDVIAPAAANDTSAAACGIAAAAAAAALGSAAGWPAAWRRQHADQRRNRHAGNGRRCGPDAFKSW